LKKLEKLRVCEMATVNFREALRAKREELSEEAAIDFDSLQASVETDESLTFWANWDAELEKTAIFLDAATLDPVTMCNTNCGPSASIACWKSNRAQGSDRLDGLFKLLELNREAMAKLADAHDQRHATASPQKQARMQIFDTRTRRAAEALEMQAFLAVVDPYKNRTYVLVAVLAVLVCVAVVLAAIRPPQDTTLLVLAAFGGFFTGFGNAGNDICNCVGTLVGSRVISMWQALLWGSIFEVIGCVALGSQVAKNITKDIIDVADFEDTPQLYSFSMVCTLFGCAGTTLLATAYGLPISATHGIIGGLIITGIIGNGVDSIGWKKVGIVCCGWIGAPIVGAIGTMLVFFLIHFVVLRHDNAAERSRRYNPLFLFICFSVNTVFMLIKGLKFLEVKPIWKAFAIAAAIGFGLTVLTMIVFWCRRRFSNEEKKLEETPTSPNKRALREETTPRGHEVGGGSGAVEFTTIADPYWEGNTKKTTVSEAGANVSVETTVPEAGTTSKHGTNTHGIDELDEMLRLSFRPDPTLENEFIRAKIADIVDQRKDVDDPVETPFNFPLILSGLSLALAHGGNDVGNAVGPFAAVLAVMQTGEVEKKPDPPLWTLLVGAISFLCGILLIGRHTIKVVGNQITTLTASKAFSVQIGASISILGASSLGLPVSTSQCLVGSVVGGALAGQLFGGEGVDMKIMLKILKAWLATIPFAMAVAASFFGPFKGFFD